MARMSPNHQAVWRPTRPAFTITLLNATSRNCYHESLFEVVSRIEMDKDDFERLDDCGLLGSGQAYYIQSSDQLTETVGPVVVDARTGALIPDAQPWSAIGTLLTNTHDFTFYRYTIKRVCDSGD